MNSGRVLGYLACASMLASSFALGQFRAGSDTSIIFQPSSPELIRKVPYQSQVDAWGFDVLISNNGFGAGVFFRHEYSDEFSLVLNLAISDVKDDAEVERFTIYGQSYVPGKKNRLLLIPLTAGFQYRLFKDDIVDNFRPYISAGIGPSMVFVAPYATTHTYDLGNGASGYTVDQIDFFNSLKYGQARYTLGGYIGAGAYFGIDKGSLSGISIRYYIAPFPSGIEVMDGVPVKNFGGFFITLNFGSIF